MTYGNYAPFYRPGFFNTMQTPPMPVQDNMGQYAQPYQPPVQQAPQMPQNQPMQNAAQTNNDIIWVQGEAGAKAYLVAPNNTVILWDSENHTIYVKSADMNGVPSMRILDYTERTVVDAPKTPVERECKCGSKFVSIDKFNALQSEFEALRGELEELKAKPRSKTAKKAIEEVEYE